MITLEQHLEEHQYLDTFDGWESCECGWREELERRSETGSIFTHAAHVAGSWRDARTVRTVEELDALPTGSILLDPGGLTPSLYTKTRGGWLLRVAWERLNPDPTPDYTDGAWAYFGEVARAHTWKLGAPRVWAGDHWGDADTAEQAALDMLRAVAWARQEAQS